MGSRGKALRLDLRGAIHRFFRSTAHQAHADFDRRSKFDALQQFTTHVGGALFATPARSCQESSSQSSCLPGPRPRIAEETIEGKAKALL